MAILAFRSKSSFIPSAIKTKAIRTTDTSINLSIITYLMVILLFIINNNIMQKEFIHPGKITAKII